MHTPSDSIKIGSGTPPCTFANHHRQAVRLCAVQAPPATTVQAKTTRHLIRAIVASILPSGSDSPSPSHRSTERDQAHSRCPPRVLTGFMGQAPRRRERFVMRLLWFAHCRPNRRLHVVATSILRFPRHGHRRPPPPPYCHLRDKFGPRQSPHRTTFACACRQG